MFITKDNKSNKDNPKTCDIWDTDYKTDNWEPGLITIFVIWQLIVTLDSIRNSCNILFNFCVVQLMLGFRRSIVVSINWLITSSLDHHSAPYRTSGEPKKLRAK